MTDSKIQWTNKTWNPTTGCTKVSQGCKHCYAERIANRLWATQYPPNLDGSARAFTDIRLHEDRLDQPAHWKTPQRVFVDSMSDLFHEDIPFDFIDRVFAIMALVPQHTYQILTKRPERALAYLSNPDRFLMVEETADLELQRLAGVGTFLDTRRWPLPNVWLGSSVEDQSAANLRVPLLLQTPAAVRFLSCEPLLGPVDLDSREFLCADWRRKLTIGTYVDWVIVGGESGTSARPFHLDWARAILAQCRAAGVACFIKQLGAKPLVISQAEKTRGAQVVLNLRDSHGGNMDEWPLDLRVREFPQAVPA